MKVDLGQCAVCGAKNSKYVEKCYKCGAALPWAPGYVAPKNAPQKPAPQPNAAPANAPVAPTGNAGAKTVATTPIDANSAPAKPASETSVSPTVSSADAPTVAQRAQSKVQVPAWALVAGGLGLMALGMALWAFLATQRTPVGVVVAPTPATTPAATAPALAPIAPAVTAQPTGAPTAQATPQATVEATPQATIAPAIQATAPAMKTPAPSVAAAPETGPSFDELYANLTTGTAQQQALYWDSVVGRNINWRGEFVSLGNAAAGPLIVNCKSAKGALKVSVSLDTTDPQTLPSFTAGQSVPFAGVLEGRSAGQITVKDGRAG